LGGSDLETFCEFFENFIGMCGCSF
jgi:hypothetical protein